MTKICAGDLKYNDLKKHSITPWKAIHYSALTIRTECIRFNNFITSTGGYYLPVLHYYMKMYSNCYVITDMFIN